MMVLWYSPKGYGGKGGQRGFRMGGTHVYLWLVHVDTWQNHHNIIIILQLKLIEIFREEILRGNISFKNMKNPVIFKI